MSLGAGEDRDGLQAVQHGEPEHLRHLARLIAVTRTLLAPAVLLTGLPSAGKSTVGAAVVASLREHDHDAELLDGDELRDRLPPAIGFTRAARRNQLARALFVAELLSSHRVIAVLALVAPFAADRALGARCFSAVGWCEVHLEAPPEVMIERDSNGLYARLLQEGGQELVRSQVLAQYERPRSPALRIDTAESSVGGSVDAILAALRSGCSERTGGLQIRRR